MQSSVAISSAEIISDAPTSYANLKGFVKLHHIKVISKKEDRGKLPWIHIAISNAKRQLLNSCHNVKPEFLQAHLDEFCYKFNRRYFQEALFGRLLVAAVSYKNESKCKHGYSYYKTIKKHFPKTDLSLGNAILHIVLFTEYQLIHFGSAIVIALQAIKIYTGR